MATIQMRLSRNIAKMALLCALVCAALLASVAAANAAPAWRIDSLSNTTVAAGDTLSYAVTATNIGDETTSGEIVMSATLPAGKMTATEASVRMPDGNSGFETVGACTIENAGATVRCSNTAQVPQVGANLSLNALFEELDLTVVIDAGDSGTLTSTFGVSGGGASSEAKTVDPVRISATPPGFGFDAADSQLLNGAGEPSRQAGAHPDSMTFSFDFNTSTDPLRGKLWPVAPVKDLSVDLPPGLVGNPTVVDTCTAGQLANSIGDESRPLCPPGSQVGTTMVRMNVGTGSYTSFFGPVPVYNMVPPPGIPARLGFDAFGSVVALDANIRTGGDYGLTVSSKDIPEGLTLLGTTTTLWGVPASPSHDAERTCPGQDPPAFGGPRASDLERCPTPFIGSSLPQKAYLRNPTSCGTPGSGLPFAARIDSWFEPGVQHETIWTEHEALGYPAAPSEWGAPVTTTGCEQVPFNPTLEGRPQKPNADSPSGFNFELTLPQSGDPQAIDESDLRKAVVTLPEGVRVSAASANGLASCSSAQIELHGAGPAACPQASRIGAVNILTPLLSEPLSGSIYVASQGDNPFGSLLAIYLVAEGSGVRIKLAGHVEADSATGRLTTTFEDNPQAPFSDLQLEFFGGDRAPLQMPAACGVYTTQAQLTSWSGRTVTVRPTFAIDHGVGGGACAPAGFAPSFTAGTTANRAGAFSPFGLSFSRNDSEQQIAGLSFTMPPGVSAVLTGVARCSEADVKAAESETGGCPQASRIGSVTVGAGSGPDPYFLKGSVYFTGPYNNGPFGEVVVVPAVAGPFNLGDVVVRGSIRVDPKTAQATVVSDPFPLFVKSTGIPADVRRVDVSVDRPGFTFNPTNCNELQATGTLSSAQGASERVSSRFQAADCANLAFHPRFTASTQGKTSRREGASLDVKVGFKAGQANIAKVKVSLPRALPSRLDTLKLACTDAVFQANPAACPAASRVGAAVARTPILSVPITGPAYIVSHGGAAFPDLEMVLQGEGVTLVLDGHTDISPKTNITTSTFDAVPDVPVSSFELKLPEGVHSVLGAPGGALCGKTLTMPTTLTGQNGAVLRQATPVNVTGCKPAIRVVGHTVKGSQASIRVTVPSAGTLVAGGTGIGRSVQHARGAQVVTIDVTLGKHDRQVLAKNPRQRVNAKVTLRFKPKRGAPLTAYVSLLMG